MLAIAYGCERFHDYLFGQDKVEVETDHKPLEAIFKKPIHKAPPRLQRMLLRVQPYSLHVQYKKGAELYIADALSRHYLPNTDPPEEDEYEVHILETGQVSEAVYERLVKETKSDPELVALRKVVMSGWPDEKNDVPTEVIHYWNYRDEITMQDDLMMKHDRIIIPQSLRRLVLHRIHSGHFGMEKCKARADVPSIGQE